MAVMTYDEKELTHERGTDAILVHSSNYKYNLNTEKMNYKKCKFKNKLIDPFSHSWEKISLRSKESLIERLILGVKMKKTKSTAMKEKAKVVLQCEAASFSQILSECKITCMDIFPDAKPFTKEEAQEYEKAIRKAFIPTGRTFSDFL